MDVNNLRILISRDCACAGSHVDTRMHACIMHAWHLEALATARPPWCWQTPWSLKGSHGKAGFCLAGSFRRRMHAHDATCMYRAAYAACTCTDLQEQAALNECTHATLMHAQNFYMAHVTHDNAAKGLRLELRDLL